MTRPDLPLIGPLHAWLVGVGDLMGVGLVVLALLGAILWFAAHDLRAEAVDRAAGAGRAEGAGWFWDFTEPGVHGGSTEAAPAAAEPSATAVGGARRGRPEVRTKVA